MVVIKQGDSPEQVKKKLKKIFEKKEDRKKFFESFLGVIKLNEDPLAMQRLWRDEW